MLWVANNADELRPMLSRLARHLEEKRIYPVQVKPSKFTPGRSLGQNAYAHKVFGQIAAELRQRTGLDYTADFIKTKLKREFGIVRSLPDPVTGEPAPYLASTADYSQGEMMDFITAVLAYANDDLGIEVLPAGEYRELKREHG